VLGPRFLSLLIFFLPLLLLLLLLLRLLLFYGVVFAAAAARIDVVNAVVVFSAGIIDDFTRARENAIFPGIVRLRGLVTLFA